MKKKPGIIGALALATSIYVPVYAADASVSAELKDLIPTNMPGVQYYEIGGAKMLSLPAYNRSRFRFRASAGINGTMMCNAFDPSISMENILNGAKQGWASFQRNIVNSIQGTIASLPMLAIQKLDPGLYEMMQSGIIAAEDQFQLEVASCERITGDMTKGNYFDGWVKASGYEEYASYFTQSDSGTAAPVENGDAGEMVKKAESEMGKEGTTWVCGEKRGGEGQQPIVMSEVVLASYNRMIDRGNCEGLSPASSEANPQFVKFWPRPADAQTWFVDVFGEMQIRTVPGQEPLDSKPGAGLVSKIDDNAPAIAEKLSLIVVELRSGQEPSINDLRSVSAPGVLTTMDVIRALSASPDAELLIGRLAVEIATQRELSKAFEMRRLLASARNLNEIVQLPAARELVVEWIDRIGEEVRMVREEIEFRRMFTSSGTMQFILNDKNNKLLRAAQ